VIRLATKVAPTDRRSPPQSPPARTPLGGLNIPHLRNYQASDGRFYRTAALLGGSVSPRMTAASGDAGGTLRRLPKCFDSHQCDPHAARESAQAGFIMMREHHA